MRKALFISLLIHALLALLCWQINLHQSAASQEIELTWQSVETVLPSLPTPPAPPRPVVDTVLEPETFLPASPSATTVAEIITMDSSRQVQTDSLKPAIALDYAANYFNKKLIEKPTADSLAANVMPMRPGLALSKEPPMIGSHSGDLSQRLMNQRSQPFAKPVPLSDLGRAIAQQLKSPEKPRPVTLRFVPSDAELAVLQTIWNQGSITDQAVYANLDTSIKLTAVDVNGILKGLEEKGLLTSELISPRDEFTFASPLGSVGIEKSATNRRNRVYRYKPLVDRKHMIRYLQARLDQAKNPKRRSYRTRVDSARTVLALQGKILKLIK